MENKKNEIIKTDDPNFWNKILEDAFNEKPITVEEQNKKLVELFSQLRM